MHFVESTQTFATDEELEIEEVVCVFLFNSKLGKRTLVDPNRSSEGIFLNTKILFENFL